VQRGLNYAIVDEVDSILIDEARTPLIISGQAEDHTDLYIAINKVVPLLTKQEGEADPRTGEGVTKPGDFTVDEKTHQVFLTEEGHEKAEQHACPTWPDARRRDAVRPGQHHADAPPERGAAGQPPVPPRPALRGAGRREWSSSTSSPAA
jgi:hypothetical protein